jgi:hypothetical protein
MVGLETCEYQEGEKEDWKDEKGGLVQGAKIYCQCIDRLGCQDTTPMQHNMPSLQSVVQHEHLMDAGSGFLAQATLIDLARRTACQVHIGHMASGSLLRLERRYTFCSR